MTTDEIRRGFSKGSVVEAPHGITVVYSRANALNEWISEEDPKTNLTGVLKEILPDAISLYVSISRKSVKLEFRTHESPGATDVKINLPLKKQEPYASTPRDINTPLTDQDLFLMSLHDKYDWNDDREMALAMKEFGEWISRNYERPRKYFNLEIIRNYDKLCALAAQFVRQNGPWDIEIHEPDYEFEDFDSMSFDGSVLISLDCDTLGRLEFSSMITGESLSIFKQIVKTATVICFDIRFESPMFLVTVYP